MQTSKMYMQIWELKLLASIHGISYNDMLSASVSTWHDKIENLTISEIEEVS